jgi:hypothetical protein
VRKNPAGALSLVAAPAGQPEKARFAYATRFLRISEPKYGL